MNTRSLLTRERRFTFANAINAHSYDIFCVSESWLTPDMKNSELFLPNFTIFRAARQTRNGNSAHGGVLIGIKNSYHFEQVYIASTEDSLSSSYVCVSVSLRDCKLLVCCVYKPPKDSPYRLSTDSVKHFLSTACTLELFNHVLITGDWNLPKTDWSLYSSTDDYEDEINNPSYGLTDAPPASNCASWSYLEV